MKQTAVEFLIEQITNSTMPVRKAIEQAKEMEKQQMRDASCPYIGGWEDDEFEDYYNENYKNTEQ